MTDVRPTERQERRETVRVLCREVQVQERDGKAGTRWVAQSIEHDICAQGADCDAALGSLQRLFIAHFQFSKHESIEIFRGIRRVPDDIEQQFMQGNQDRRFRVDFRWWEAVVAADAETESEDTRWVIDRLPDLDVVVLANAA